MSALSLRLPHSLHERARTLARREGISINQLISTALAEKISALLTRSTLENEGNVLVVPSSLPRWLRFQTSSPKTTINWQAQRRASGAASPVVTLLLEKNNARVFRVATPGEW